MSAFIPVLGIPHYNRPELLRRCLASIDVTVGYLVIVDNSVGGLDEDWRGAEIIRCPTNAGVAGGWNLVLKQYAAPWWVLANDDIQFAPGDLAKLAAAVRSAPSEGGPGVFYGNHGASWFALTDHCVGTVGTFDENLHPAYLEDCDHARRCDLLGVQRVTVADVHARHGDDQRSGSCTVNKTPALAAQNSRTHGNNFAYYRAKWGGENGREVFSHPFNDPGWPVWAWRFDPRWRRRQQWIP